MVVPLLGALNLLGNELITLLGSHLLIFLKVSYKFALVFTKAIYPNEKARTVVTFQDTAESLRLLF